MSILLKKLKIELPYDLVIPLLGIDPKKIKILIGKDTYTPIFITVLFLTAKTGCFIKCPSIVK